MVAEAVVNPPDQAPVMPDKLHCYEYPRPAVTVDVVVFAHRGQQLVTLMVQRGREPFAGSWAVPGGFLDMDEEIEDGVRRELREETGLKLWVSLQFLGIFGKPGRDPRGRTISLAYVAYLPGEPPEVEGGDDARVAEWRPAGRDDPTTPLAFDHHEILSKGLDWFEGFDGVATAGMLNF